MKLKVVNYRDGSKGLSVNLDYPFSHSEMALRVWHQMNSYGAPLPLTRKEALESLIRDIQRGHAYREYDDMPDNILPRIIALFPELV